MKRILLAALLAVGPVVADEPFLRGDELAAEVSRNCAEGCLVLNPAEAADLMARVQAMVVERQQAAFEAGFAQGSKSCRNAI